MKQLVLDSLLKTRHTVTIKSTKIYLTIIGGGEFNMSTEDAVYKPKFHHQWLPDEVMIEKGFPVAVKEAMQKMGYSFSRERGGIGRTECIRVLPNGKFEAVADNRGDDAAEGY